MNEFFISTKKKIILPKEWDFEAYPAWFKELYSSWEIAKVEHIRTRRERQNMEEVPFMTIFFFFFLNY